MANLVLRAEVEEVLEALKPLFGDDLAIEAVVLFGSQARGESVITSDIDLAIVSKQPQLIDRKTLIYAAESFDVDCDFVYTTPDALAEASHVLDVNLWIREEGVEIWRR